MKAEVCFNLFIAAEVYKCLPLYGLNWRVCHGQNLLENIDQQLHLVT